MYLVDGCGVLHHRRCGSASHLGVQLGVPTIGVAKQLLAVDGLQEWLVVKELRNALAQVCTAVRSSVPGGAGVHFVEFRNSSQQHTTGGTDTA